MYFSYLGATLWLASWVHVTDSRDRRLSAGENVNPIPLLRDIDQPFIFHVNLSGRSYRLEFQDTSSPENWRVLDPDVVVICYDIGQRLSLVNMKRYVSSPNSWLPLHGRVR